jgi:hypothetical protein
LLTLVVLLFLLGPSIPLSIPAFAYARVEKRTRRAWAGLPGPTTSSGEGPYRNGRVPGVPLVRAPLLVRAAAMSGYYWACVSALAWAVVAATAPREVACPLAALGAGVILLLAQVGSRLLRRDGRVVTTGPRVAVIEAAHGVLVVALAAALPGQDSVALAVVFALPAIAHATLLAAAVRSHRDLLGLQAAVTTATPSTRDTPV